MSGKTNVLLVHGAWADGSCWAKVIPLLQAKGLDVIAAQIPLISLEDDIAVTRRMLGMLPNPTVLVGHSYGGAVITGAAIGAENVKSLVYIAAFGLDEGESLEILEQAGGHRLAVRRQSGRTKRLPLDRPGANSTQRSSPTRPIPKPR